MGMNEEIFLNLCEDLRNKLAYFIENSNSLDENIGNKFRDDIFRSSNYLFTELCLKGIIMENEELEKSVPKVMAILYEVGTKNSYYKTASRVLVNGSSDKDYLTIYKNNKKSLDESYQKALDIINQVLEIKSIGGKK